MEEKSDSKICPRCGYAEGAAPESALHLPPGTVLQGKYLLGRTLGQGGSGETRPARFMRGLVEIRQSC